jgi:hypothetical protein
MKFKIVIGVVVLVLLAVSFGIWSSRKTQAQPIIQPWAEVLSDSLFELDATTREPKATIASGDELEIGDVLQTNNAGIATIHYPDGSVARIDPNTTFTIDTHSYNSSTGQQSTGLKLEAGRIWSKVFELATPSSSWEVKTSNTVATVRGTAFGVSAEGNRTIIAGSEHEISLQIRDSQTSSPIGDPALIGEKKYIVIDDGLLARLKDNPKALIEAVIDVPEDVKNSEWWNNNRSQDDTRNLILKDIKDKNSEQGAYRKAVAKYFQDKFRDDIKRQRRIGRNPVYRFVMELQEELKSEDGAPETTGATKPTPKPTTGGSNTGTPPVSTPSPQAVPQRLAVYSFSDTANIKSGATLIFKALVSYSDGSQQDVTSSSSWSADSSIGAISSPGVLTAPTYTQSPSVSGYISAKWTNPATGVQLLAKSFVQITFQRAPSPNTKP